MKRYDMHDSKMIFDVIFEKWFYLVGDIKSLIIEDYNDAISYKVNYLIDEKNHLL